MNFLTSDAFSTIMTLGTLAMCFVAMVVTDSDRVAPHRRRLVLAVTAVMIAIWLIDVIARFMYAE